MRYSDFFLEINFFRMFKLKFSIFFFYIIIVRYFGNIYPKKNFKNIIYWLSYKVLKK